MGHLGCAHARASIIVFCALDRLRATLPRYGKGSEILSPWAGSHSHTGSVSPDSGIGPERIDYDSKSAAMVGRRVLGVRYWDVRNFTAEPRDWDYGDWHHAVMGVELLTDRGPSCVLWTSTFFPYGVEVFQTPMSEHVLAGEFGPEAWAVSGSARWRGRLNSPVAGVQTFWEHITVGPSYVRGARAGDPYEVDIPVALRIDFAAGPVWMVAGMPKAPGMREVSIGGDEIMVVFTAERMRQIGFPDSGFLAPLSRCRPLPASAVRRRKSAGEQPEPGLRRVITGVVISCGGSDRAGGSC